MPDAPGGPATATRPDAAPGPPAAGPATSRRWQPSWWDLAIAAGVLVLLYALVRLGRGAPVSYLPGRPTTIDTAAGQLPYYAARSLLRMFEALAVAAVFSVGYGWLAARHRRLERVLIPALDIIQAVPVLGLLSIAAAGVVRLVPGTLADLEAVSVFAIATAQAPSMAFGFYQSLIALPTDLDEVSRSFRFSRWMRFRRVELPHGAIGLVWNGMMGFAGGWFFLVASETVSVTGEAGTLPGVGSYAGRAIADGDLTELGLAILVMVALVLGVNLLFWRPLVAWAERFKMEHTESGQVQRSLVLDLLRRSGWPRLTAPARRAGNELVHRAGDLLTTAAPAPSPARPPAPRRRRGAGDVVFAVVVLAALAAAVADLLWYLHTRTGLGVFAEPARDGLYTLARVVVVVLLASLVWVPVGVRIGFSPRLARLAQPVVLLAASFPANFLFPLVTLVLLHTGAPLSVGGVLLLALGTQWYILFNTIAGTMAIPTDLREAMDVLGVRGVLRWRRLILPAVFPAYVTGAITAAGGAWNASIVAEIVSFGGVTLSTPGLGGYIADHAAGGDYPRVLAGVVVMSAYLLLINRLLWRRLYRLVRRRFVLDG